MVFPGRALLAAAILPLAAAFVFGAGTPPPDRYPNLFADWLGKSQLEIDAKINGAWKHFFQGEPQYQRLYFPVSDDMAYIADTGNEDVRTEGMSYGMMLAVQTDHKAEFDRLWKWARTHMYHAEGPRKGYFAWHCRYDGTQIDQGSASDGEEWFIMALLFASNRWGDGQGIFNYRAEAQALLKAVLTDRRGEGVGSIFNLKEKQVTFVPSGPGSQFTDPSYHLPAFYELWAQWSDTDRAFWSEATKISREFFRKAAHKKTGLMPEYANYDGTPRPGYPGAFRYDAFRILHNVALDYAWWRTDPWQKEQSNRILRFFVSQGPDFSNQYSLDGKPLGAETSVGLYAMAAAAGLAADRDVAQPFVQRLWELEPPTGKYRYYDGLLYFFGLLEVSGRFRIHEPAAK
ncbi:glycoside hydrolase [Opitutaceae bacterium EW11]|nr:glycoside hydrolase [Opitutaceae bacterium EW11]